MGRLSCGARRTPRPYATLYSSPWKVRRTQLRLLHWKLTTGYYDGVIFHRIVKGFIVQSGDPTGAGKGGESIYGEPFQDEIHSRLKFNRYVYH